MGVPIGAQGLLQGVLIGPQGLSYGGPIGPQGLLPGGTKVLRHFLFCMHLCSEA